MDRDELKKSFKLIKSDGPDHTLKNRAPNINEDMENYELETEFMILTGAPDYPVAIDSCAPLEVKVRVLAAVKSYTLGNKSVDYCLKQYRHFWEEHLSGGEG